MKRISPFLLILLVVLSSCTPKAPSPVDIEALVSQRISKIPTFTAYPTYTSQPTYTPYPTYTSLPTYTPLPTHTPQPVIVITATYSPTPRFTSTETGTPTETPKPSPTSNPFNLSGCVSVVIKPTADTSAENIYAQVEKYVGKCVKIYFYEDKFINTVTEYGLSSDFIYSFKVTNIFDEITPPDTAKPSGYNKIWGILEKPNEDLGPWKIHLRKVEQFPKNQWPKQGEGRYMVGKDAEMFPGLWKSGVLQTRTDSCYWARINPATGNIKDNHFGIAGISVRVYEGEIFDTNNDCTPWYYTGP